MNLQIFGEKIFGLGEGEVNQIKEGGKRLRHIQYSDNESILELERQIDKFDLGMEYQEINDLLQDEGDWVEKEKINGEENLFKGVQFFPNLE